MHPNSRRFKKLMAKERKLMLQGGGAFKKAQRRLQAEAERQDTEEWYKGYQRSKKRKRQVQSRDRWAGQTADMLYNRKHKKRVKGY